MSIPHIVGSGLYNALSGIFSRAEGVSYVQHVYTAIFRAKYATTDYSKPTNEPSAVDVYHTDAQKRKFEPNVIKLQTGGNGFWYGSPTAKNVLFYLPGGGFVWPPIEGHSHFLYNVQQSVQGNGTDFAIFCFAYDLLPAAKHPTQLRQVVAAFNYLIETTNLDPSNIILGGDSAGANMSLMLLSHASHPYPGVEAPKFEHKSLRATVLLCPWVSMVNKGPNLERNKNICYVSDAFVGEAGKLWVADTGDDGYTSPLKNTPEWWKDVPSGDIFVAGGEYEYFVDDIDAIVDKLKVYKSVEYLRGKYEVHDHFVVAAANGLPPSESDIGLRSFIKSKL